MLPLEITASPANLTQAPAQTAPLDLLINE